MLRHTLATILVLASAVVVLTTLARRLRLPYPCLLALGGLGMALVPGLPRLHLDPDIVLLVFLPPLLFAAGWRTPWREFAEQLGPISVLAVGLVLFTTIGVGYVAHVADGALPLAVAMVLGALVSPTDPLAASAVARQVHLPQRIVTLLEGESLANDATGLVVYQIAVVAVMSGHFSALEGAAHFVLLATGGVAVGCVVGLVSAGLQRIVDEPPIEFAVQVLTAYAAYLLADRFAFSGVFASVAAGLVCGRFWSYSLGASSRLRAVAVWDTIDFLLNAVLFLVLGLQLRTVLAEAGPGSLAFLLPRGLVVSGVAIVLRMAWIFAGAHVAQLRTDRAHRTPLNVLALLGWSGMRGVLSLTTALAIPQLLPSGEAFPGRPHIVFYAFCVIIVTLVVQGLPLPWITRWLRIPRDERHHEAERLARITTARAARDRVASWDAAGDELVQTLLTELRGQYERELEYLERARPAHQSDRIERELEHMRREITLAQRQALLSLHARGLIDDRTYRRIERELDLAQAQSTGDVKGEGGVTL